ncbi:hypothetical protein D9619_009572 [Psilocybe cf. subviscida]|uniref:Uncharacterized protein n=1 Tax=Psilocybe cf. subviscida TaxID=2480587 RepID=A0A8H5F6G7_9AGAR|nr:hypothetical protein D9619_009572 [Psilocybe cf. subviscida]
MNGFTVHEYQKSRSSPNIALDNGYKLLKALVFPETQWVHVGGREPYSYTQSSNSYQFRVKPPVVARNSEDTLKEWNAPCTEGEVYTLENLEEFAGTDFQNLLVSKFTQLLPPPPSPLPPQTDSLDNDSIYGALSQPSNIVNNENDNKSEKACIQEHSFIPGFDLHPESRLHEPKHPPEIISHVIPGFDLDAPLKTLHTEHQRSVSTVESAGPKKRRLSQELFVTKRSKPVVGSLYSLIPQPHMHASPFLASKVCLSSTAYTKPPLWTKCPPPCDDARVAWLVPVRGTLPWEGSTPAMLDDATVSPDARISWTQEALTHFWDFILDLRQSATFGSLGVAFHPANARALPPPRLSSPGIALPDPRSALPSVDFIKIYLDAGQRLYLRSVLDEWTLRVDGELRELSPLCGARLVLVDELSQAILIV